MMCKKKISKPWPFNCEKWIAIVICGKSMVWASNFSFVSSSCFPFQKPIVSHEVLPNLVEKTKKICFTKIGKLYIYNKF